ncbi:MAG TPA: glutathione S-transferase family protein [Polyangiaceae bacterium]|nr:glutathione S-transferase family protein [Polyangiaceae bacterium]
MRETIRLYTFTISHFCEKARWALDRTGAGYREVILLPGFHRRRMKGFGGGGMVPLLTHGPHVVDGSSAIIDFADSLGGAPPLTPVDPALRAEALEWEAYLDREVGETLRRALYFYLFDHPRLVVRAWSLGAPFWAPAMYGMISGRAIAVVRRYLKIDAATVQSDQQRVLAAFERASERLASRPFLVGDTFTRADLTLAALSAPLLRPEQHPWRMPEAREPIAAVDALARRIGATRAGEHVAASYAKRRREAAPAPSLGAVNDSVQRQRPA